jgi:hypothetical protein
MARDTVCADVGICFQHVEFRNGLFSHSISRGPALGLGSVLLKVPLGGKSTVMSATEFRGLPPVVVPVGDDYAVCPAVGELAYCRVAMKTFDPATRTGTLLVTFIVNLAEDDPFRTVAWYLPETEVPFKVKKPIVFSSVLQEGEERTVGAVRNSALEADVVLTGSPDRKLPFIPMAAERLPGEDAADVNALVQKVHKDRVVPLDDWPALRPAEDGQKPGVGR